MARVRVSGKIVEILETADQVGIGVSFDKSSPGWINYTWVDKAERDLYAVGQTLECEVEEEFLTFDADDEWAEEPTKPGVGTPLPQPVPDLTDEQARAVDEWWQQVERELGGE